MVKVDKFMASSLSTTKQYSLHRVSVWRFVSDSWAFCSRLIEASNYRG